MGTRQPSASPPSPQWDGPVTPAAAGVLRRHPRMAGFIDALCAVLTDKTQGHPLARRLVQHMLHTLDKQPGEAGTCVAQALPVCIHLDAALAHVRDKAPGLSGIADRFAALAPHLHWQLRAGAESTSPAFRSGHANAQIIGPNGLERRHDLVVGVSLMAPSTVYPQHQHPPREIYLVLSDGQWWSEGKDWTTPGLGGIVYHPSAISHGMRSGSTPLLAIWCLWPVDVVG